MTTAQAADAKADTALATAQAVDAKADQALADSSTALDTANAADAKADEAIAGVETINDALFGTSIALGQGSTASENAVAIGVDQVANGSGAVAIGDPNVATGTGAVAIGADNTATGDGAVAVGNLSSAVGQGSVAIGNAATAGTNGVAVGNGASTGGFANSVALGAGSVNTADNQVNVGGRTIGGVAAGALNATSTDAVNGSQLFATNQALAAMSSQIGAIPGMQNDISNLYDLRRQDRKDMRQGVASAIAMANAPIPSNPGGVSYAVNGAAFRGEYAVGGSVSYRLNTENPTALSVGFSYAGNKNNGVRVGVAGEF